MTKKCDCKHPEYTWYLETNESVWHCLSCQEKLGYSSSLDKDFLGMKVRSVKFAIQEFGLVHFSDSTDGDIDCCKVIQSCESQMLYDQYTIILEFIKLEQPGHSRYWQKRRKNPDRKGIPKADWDELNTAV